MVNNATVSKLRELKLSAMANEFLLQEGNASIFAMSFDERFGMLVDSEYNARENSRLTRLIRNAGYPNSGACLEDVEYHPDRRLNKDLITRLGICNYIPDRHNVIIQGATGSGKTYLACALGIAANRRFYSVKYVRLPDLLGELGIARVENNFAKTINSYQKYKLLILDEWLLYPLNDVEARDLLELAERRYRKFSTIFCSQFSTEGWHEKIGNALLADAVCDRIVHDAHTITILGDKSMRERKGLSAPDSTMTQ